MKNIQTGWGMIYMVKIPTSSAPGELVHSCTSFSCTDYNYS